MERNYIFKENLQAVDFDNKEYISFRGTVIKIFDEGNLDSDKKRPIKFQVKLESSGESAYCYSWSKAHLDTVKGLVDSLDVYEFKGEASKYRDVRQILVSSMSFTGIVSEQKQLRTIDGDKIRKDINAIIMANISNPIFKALLKVLVLDNEKFWIWPAASKMHHNFKGGLALHSLNVTKNVISLADRYPGIHRELAITGAILHDIGKLEEYTETGERTTKGNLFSHLYLGAEKVNDAAKYIVSSNDSEGLAIIDMLKHIIVSHHEKLEFGAIVKPYTIDAWAVARADAVDALMEEASSAVFTLGLGEEYPGKVPGLDNGILRWS